MSPVPAINITPDEVKAMFDLAFAEAEKLAGGHGLVVSVLKWLNSFINSSSIPQTVADWLNKLLKKKAAP